MKFGCLVAVGGLLLQLQCASAEAADKPVLSVTITTSPKAQAALAAKGKVVVVVATMGDLEDPAITEYVQVPPVGGMANFLGRDSKSGKALKLPVSGDDDLVVNAISRPAGRPTADENNLLNCTTIGQSLKTAIGKAFALSCKAIGER